MTKLWNWIDGKKTYLVALACIVYGILALLKIAPNPDKLAVWSVQVSAFAIAFRSLASKFLGNVMDVPTGAQMGSEIPPAVYEQIQPVTAPVDPVAAPSTMQPAPPVYPGT